MTEIVSHIMVTAVFGMLTMMVLAFMNYLLKRRIIASGRTDEAWLKLVSRFSDRLSALKWGFLLFFGGLGLIITGCMPYSPEASPIPWGVEAISLAAGFIVYYLVARKQQQSTDQL